MEVGERGLVEDGVEGSQSSLGEDWAVRVALNRIGNGGSANRARLEPRVCL